MSAEDALTQRARARVGQVLREKWRLDRLLGVGGMASVYAATHRNGMRGAVKMLHVELSNHTDTRTRFLREGYVANKVEHPGAVAVLDDDVAEDGSVYLVMELLEGETLDQRLEGVPEDKLGTDEVVKIADQLLDVLAAAHDKGIVHRDIKPENLFLVRNGTLKVLDFGVARLRELSNASHITKTGGLMGTPAFMPPEQALGNWDSVDARSDIWAVGATMFRALAGRAVHEGDTVNKVLLAAMTLRAPLLEAVAPDVPPGLAAVVDCCLEFEPRDRWSDARTMQRALRELSAAWRDTARRAAGAPMIDRPSAQYGPQPYFENADTDAETIALVKLPPAAAESENVPVVSAQRAAAIVLPKPDESARFRAQPVAEAPASSNTGVVTLAILTIVCIVLTAGALYVAKHRPIAPAALDRLGAGAAAVEGATERDHAAPESDVPTTSTASEPSASAVATGAPSAPPTADTLPSAPASILTAPVPSGATSARPGERDLLNEY